MRDSDCIAFLQWALPEMGFRWQGFRKVRRQVCKRIGRRLRQLELADLGAYRNYLEASTEEWTVLDGCCRITVSRFFRDLEVYRLLGDQILPALSRQVMSRGGGAVRLWSAGCGAGDEPYSLAILIRHAQDPHLRQVTARIHATDTDAVQLARARAAIYPPGCLHDIPEILRQAAFERLSQERLRLREIYRKGVDFVHQDLRQTMPDGPFDLILCRNLAFTYFADPIQRDVLARLLQRLAAGGYLVIGSHEHLPVTGAILEPLPHCPCLLQHVNTDSRSDQSGVNENF
jgi:chemotaxis protein methyltransferase CheR